jgi:hypothetical protein
VTDVAYSQPGITHFELPTRDAPILFDGWFIDSYDNGGGDRIRWADLHLYRWLPKDSDQLGYIIYTIGHSLVYHQFNGECGRGEAHAVSEFGELYEEGSIDDPEDLEPCDRCHPGDWRDAPDNQEFEVEVTWYKWTTCKDPDEVLLAGRKAARCRNCLCGPHEKRCYTCSCTEYAEAPRPLTIPMQRLLARVRAQNSDPDLARAMREQRIRL